MNGIEVKDRTENKTELALASLSRGLSEIEPAVWIVHRRQSLKAHANEMSLGINVAKTMSIGSSVVGVGLGLLFGATGVGIVAGGIGLASYAATLMADKLDTGRFAPLPFMRTRMGERLEILGNADARELRGRWEEAQRLAGNSTFEADDELYSNLPEELQAEAMMLAKHGGLIAQLLNQIDESKRDLAYIHLCAAYSTFGDAITGFSLSRLKDQLNGKVGGDYLKMQPAKLGQYQPPEYHIGGSDFGALPPSGEFGSIGISGAAHEPKQLALSEPPAPTEPGPKPSGIVQGQKVLSEFLAMAPAKRADALLKALKAEGCDIEAFIGDQILGTTGAQRSGKTTLLLLLSILEMAKGKELYYITVDDDVYPVAFTGIESGERGVAGYQYVIDTLSRLGKSEAKNRVYFLDECTKAVGRIGGDASDRLWNSLLTGFVKTGASVRMVVHGTTATAMGIPSGMTSQAKNEATFIEAKRARDVLPEFKSPGKYPSGHYHGLEAKGTAYEETKERWVLPSWLLFDTNADGDPCYVHSLLKLFPEFDTRVSGTKPPSFVPNNSITRQSNGDFPAPFPSEIPAQTMPKPEPSGSPDDHLGIESEPLSWADYSYGPASEFPGLPELMQWISGKANRGEGFTLAAAKTHPGVRDAIKSKTKVENVSEEIATYVGVLEGVNLLELNGEEYKKLEGGADA